MIFLSDRLSTVAIFADFCYKKGMGNRNTSDGSDAIDTDGGAERLSLPARISLIVLVCVFCVALFLFSVIDTGMDVAHMWEPWYPDYASRDISGVLEKSELTEEDYALLLEQTGLTRIGVDRMLAAGDKEGIADIQTDFFARYEYEDSEFAPFTCRERMSAYAHTVPLETGDIIVSPTAHFSGYRFGHAVLVVDGEREIVLAAEGYGQVSDLRLAGYSMFDRPSFVILRPKNNAAALAAVEYATENLLGLDYSFPVGVIGEKYPETLTATQCSHIIWYAFMKCGVDLDSNGGMVVSPWNIALSPELDVVQSYGIPPGERWY